MFREIGFGFDAALRFCFWVAGILLTFATVGTCVDAILRYLLNKPIPWMLELTEYIMLYIPFLGAALVLKEDAHIKVDVLITRFNEKNRFRLGAVTSLIGGTVMAIYTWFGAEVTLDFFQRGVPSLEYLKLPTYIILMIIPIGSFFFTIQFFRLAFSGHFKEKSKG